MQYEYVQAAPAIFIWRLREWSPANPSYTAITSAGRSVYLIYDHTPGPTWGRLLQVYLPAQTNPPPDDSVSVPDRYWTFSYGDDGSPGWLTSVTDPLSPVGNRNDFTYAAFCNSQEVPCPNYTYYGRLNSVSDKYRPGDPAFGTAQKYLHTYVSVPYGKGKASLVCDPGCSPCSSSCSNQQFTYYATTPGYITNRYFDRRGSEWKFQYNDESQNIYYAGPYPDGNLNLTYDPVGAYNHFFYDTGRNATDIVDSYGRIFGRTFDAKGNLTHQETGEYQPRSWTYDSFNNNLTSYTDPLGAVTRYCYENVDFPTLLTKIIEPDDAMSPASPTSCSSTGYPTTTMEYYTSPSDWGRGQLKEVIDPNGVWTGFDYDIWGQHRWYTEGQWQTQVASVSLGGSYGTVSDCGGYPRSSSSPGGTGGESTTDETGNPTAGKCTRFIWATTPTERFVPPGFPKLPCAVQEFPEMCAKFGTVNGASANPIYYPEGQLKSIELLLTPNGCSGTAMTRRTISTLDALQRQTKAETYTNEPGTETHRAFDYAPNWLTGTFTRTGPDRADAQSPRIDTVTQFDTANRVSTIRRGPIESPIMTATYTYWPYSSVLDSITFGNGMVQSMMYDGAARPAWIKYESGGQTVFRLDYTYTLDDLPATIYESGSLSGSATIVYTYDARRRLTSEVRTGSNPYDFAYEYDKGGNRTRKIKRNEQGLDVQRTKYYYDRTATQHGVPLDSDMFESNYNRLEYYEVYDVDPPGSGVESLDSTTWYYYTRKWDGAEAYADIGSVTWIVTRDGTSNNYSATRFGYAMNDRTLTFAAGESWTWDGNPANCPTGYAITWAREFRYDGARARYLNRQLSPSALMAGNFVSLGDTWTDYDGDTAYGDYTLSAGVATNVRSYEPGIALGDWGTNPPSAPTASSTDYFVTDHLGSTRGLTTPYGLPADAVTYSAFGEKISGANHRFGYVGQFGYQSHSEMPYLHLGARYYDPASGRFLERDRLGILGGINVYAYVAGLPTLFADPNGTETVIPPYYGAGGARAVVEVGGVISDLVKSGLIAGGVVGAGAVASEVVTDAVTAEPSTKGGVKIKGSVSDATGATNTVDVVFGPNGGIKHGPHYRGPRKNWPPFPDWVGCD